jgi:hypothetical protein
MYVKIHVGTNVFGEYLQQMLDNLKGVLPRVVVFKSVLQCANTQVMNWILTSHKNLDLTWLTAWVAQKCVALKAGTFRNTLSIQKDMFLDRDILKIGFQYCTMYDGYAKSDHEKAGVELFYIIHVIAEKKDCTLIRALITALLESPCSLHQTLIEYCLAPIFIRDNGLGQMC